VRVRVRITQAIKGIEEGRGGYCSGFTPARERLEIDDDRWAPPVRGRGGNGSGF
jgi:hypothetical protein